MKKVLVVGGLGFIGYHLCDQLLYEGVEVMAVDDSLEKKQLEQEEKEMRLGRNASFTLLRNKIEDVVSPQLLEKIDTVFHAANPFPIKKHFLTENKIIENNTEMIKKVIRSLLPATRFIYVSSVEVYGTEHSFVSEQTVPQPKTMYGRIKLAEEKCIQEQCTQNNIPFVIVRLPTIYGPWQSEEMTYQQIITGTIPPHIDSSTVDVIYVQDAISALLLAAKTTYINETFHITSGLSNAWLRGLSELIEDVRSYEKELEKMILCPEKSTKLLHFKPKITLKEGLKKQKEHVRKWDRLKQFYT